jgi:thioredoxin-dependent peroxiredoxin
VRIGLQKCIVFGVKKQKNMFHLKVGDHAPDFSLPIEDGTLIRLKDYLGKKLVLYFYPRDSTPSCTAEACSLRDDYGKFKKAGYEILGVSPDSSKSHLKFRAKFDLPFSLIADTEMVASKAFGIWGEKKFMGRVYDGIHRSTFVIDEKGVIEQIILAVDSKEHAKQIWEGETIGV